MKVDSLSEIPQMSKQTQEEIDKERAKEWAKCVKKYDKCVDDADADDWDALERCTKKFILCTDQVL